MIPLAQQAQIEFGDFQTPLVLAQHVCEKLLELGVTAHTIIEPTCGLGAFVEAATTQFPTAQKIIGVEINSVYLAALNQRKQNFLQPERVELYQRDFFFTRA